MIRWIVDNGKVNTADDIVGCIGIEQYGEEALLRSVAVLPRRQGVGIGWH